MIERHLTKLRARDRISEAEAEAIRSSIGDVRLHDAGDTLISIGQELTASTLLLDGILARAKDLSNGERQITELHVPGDFADLHSFTLKRLDHEIVALTPVRIAMVPHERLQAITEQFPHLTRVYWFSTNLDAAIHREWELSLGRRSAIARMAALFCELHIRLGIVGLTDGLSYTLQLTQADLASCLGLTPVHVNRTLRELRERKLVTFRSDRVVIHDLDGLRHVGDFDPAYLYLDRPQL